MERNIRELKEKLLAEKEHDTESVVELVRVLRSEEGCPWDREQDHRSIRSEFIEETYEAVEAIDREDPVLLCEELGDVLFQVVFHTEIEREAGRFGLGDVTRGVVDKMIARHPHVFGETKVKDTGEVLDNWDRIKTEEKSRSTLKSVLAAVPKQYPALLRAKKVAKKAEKGGISFGTEDEKREKLLSLAKRSAEAEGEERNALLAELVWQAVILAGPDADTEKDLGFLIDGFIEKTEE